MISLGRSLQLVTGQLVFVFLKEKLSCSFFRYNAVFGTALELGDVKDAKLDDETELVLDLDPELNDNLVTLKTEKLAHVSQQFL